MKFISQFVLFLCFKSVYSDLNSKLYYYETLSELTEIKRVKRSLDGVERPTSKDIRFNAFGRSFELILENNADILSKNFKATVVRKDGSTSRIHVNKNEFFQGYLAGDKNSSVDAHIEDGLWTANIYTGHDSFHVEPSWRHLPDSKYYSQIVYRSSDIKSNITLPQYKRRLCDGIKVDVDPKDIIDNRHRRRKDGSNRSKRQSWVSRANSCQVYVVADYLFHHGIGGGVKHKTLNYLINTFHSVNTIFRRTVWEKNTNLRNIGFQLQELKIHEHPSPVQAGEEHYNMNRSTQWPTRDLLEVFSRQSHHENFCLAHLLTYQKFSGGVLGLAYIASPRQRAVGGICSLSYIKDKRKLTLNSGWSSSMNTNGDRLLTKEAILVAAHEMGHNWGSEHDAETDECAPSTVTNKGKYIMYPYAVKGYDANNDHFSPCSMRYVTDVLKAKAYNCFTAKEMSAPYCGNGLIDADEECDGGKTGLEEQDPCCNKECRLKGDSKCSSMNHECCLNCQMAPADFVCNEAFQGGCFESVKCSGFSLDCPQARPADNSQSCLESGTCQNGECVSYCQMTNASYVPCRCDNNPSDACHICCRGVDGKCVKVGNKMLPEGRTCYQGICSKTGECEQNEVDMVQRLFSFIEKLTPNAFVEFMKRNIVGTVLIFSMVVWIPASWKYSCIDKKREEEEKRLTEWRSLRSNDFFLLDNAKSIKLRNSQRHRVQRHVVSVRQPMIVNRPAARYKRKPTEEPDEDVPPVDFSGEGRPDISETAL